MRSFILIPFLSSAALAFNTRICGGAGGCVSTTWAPEHPFRCPDGTRLNSQQTASNSIDTGNGSYEIITKDKFPSSCLRDVKPANTDTLLVSFKPKYPRSVSCLPCMSLAPPHRIWTEDVRLHGRNVHGNQPARRLLLGQP